MDLLSDLSIASFGSSTLLIQKKFWFLSLGLQNLFLEGDQLFDAFFSHI